MYAIDTSKEFANRNEIPEELRADFDYLETHFMYKDWVLVTQFLMITTSYDHNFTITVPLLQYFLKIPKKTTDDFINRVPKDLQKPLKFYNEEGQISNCSANDTPDIYVDSNGKCFFSVPGLTRRELDSGREVLKFHPFCCFVKSKISAGYSSVALIERLQERSYFILVEFRIA